MKLYSQLRGPIAEQGFLQRALLFAELAQVAYCEPREAAAAARQIGFLNVTFYSRDGAQAYRFRSRHDCVVACRGTEPHQWNDIRADIHAMTVLAETAGRIHRGFKREVDDLWPMLETALMHNQQTLWFCGHSLGGAMATICAGRCFLSHIDSNPQQLFTFGSPRVGDKRYIHHVSLDHYRFVNNNDVVTQVPPGWLGYRHAGTEIYLDRHGQLRRLGRVARRRDQWLGFLCGVAKGTFDQFADHSIGGYVAAIADSLASPPHNDAARRYTHLEQDETFATATASVRFGRPVRPAASPPPKSRSA